MLPPTYSSSSMGNSVETSSHHSDGVFGGMLDLNPGDSGFAGAASLIQKGGADSGKSRGVDGHSFLDSPNKGLNNNVNTDSADNIWGLPVSSSASVKTGKNVQRRIPAMAHIHDAVVFFPNKVAYHISCFYHAQSDDMNY
jgi:hypothetical protein